MTVTRRDFLRATAAGTVTGGLTSALQASQGKRLNILWIMTDQQPISTIGAYGNKIVKTPNLDRIAADGMRLNRFHISAFPCSPSRACFFTGREAHHHGVVTNDVPLAADVPALGDVLKAAGYDTGYVGKWHLSGSMYRDLAGRKPLDGNWQFERVEDASEFKFKHAPGGTGEDAAQHGFDFWVGGWKHYHEYLRSVGLTDIANRKQAGNHNDMPSGPEGTHIYSKLPQEHHMASFFADKSVEFLRKQKGSDRPFGLVLSFYGPHLPVAPPKPWDEMYSMEQVDLPTNHRDELKDKPLAQRNNRRCYKLPDWEDDQFKDYIRRYWGYCGYIDRQIGRVLKALDETGRADETIVLFTADHGDMVAAHGFVFKLGHCGYDELLRVPFLIRCPGRIKPGGTSDALVSSIDVLPTLLEMTGVKPPAGIDGASFSSVLKEPGRSHRDAILCNSMERNLTVATDRWKYVLNWSPRDLDELYDLKADPGEMKNLAGDKAHAETVHQMRRRIRKWLHETRHPYARTILERMLVAPQVTARDLWPEITEFKYLGGDEFEYTVVWHAVDEPPKTPKFWSFTHFINKKYGKDGGIVFRDTTWPEPPTIDWKKGGAYQVGPIKVKIPKHAGPGEYLVRIGLYNPPTRATPGMLARGKGNAVEMGTLVIEKKEDAVSSVSFRPIKRRR
ncbi:MAG: sulfatase-like hydrolase/transferase [Phycisphaerae bacterium]|nr:sulfatase-like hydrolase/transferase [Phycisphaerae bacterium]